MAGVCMALADIHRAYVAHIEDGDVHDTADTTNGLSYTLGGLLDLHQAFLDAERKTAPSTPSTVNPAVTTLVHGAGFREL